MARRTESRHESQAMRAGNRKAIKPQPTYQTKLVAWHLTFRVPLNYAAIPETEIAQACERFKLPLETWTRQDAAFGLLRKVYVKRAKIRGEQPLYQWSTNAERAESEPAHPEAESDSEKLGVSVGL